MNEILIITNNAEDTQLIDLGYKFACQIGNNIVIAQMYKGNTTWELSPQIMSMQGNCLPLKKANHVNEFLDKVSYESNNGHLPHLKTIVASDFTGQELVGYIHREGFAMVICRRLEPTILNIQSLLNQLNCPVMLVPEGFANKEINRTVYLTDLRYCQQSILSRLSKFQGSSLLLAHICQSGLPDLELNYGEELFTDAVGRYSTSQELFYSHIKEKNILKITDILINTMRADMLVCVNRGFHFQQFFGNYLPQYLPGFMSVPLLVFPC